MSQAEGLSDEGELDAKAHLVKATSVSLMQSALPIGSGKRLQFIDNARGIAILLMLEGHFVGLTLAPEWRVESNVIYEIWNYIRGITGPMFLFVTGLVFSYLLTGSKETNWWQMRRVRRGLLRVLELLFWGYLLQFNFVNLPAILSGKPDGWLQAFHVLQCIAIGLFVMIFSFICLRKLPLPALMGCYVLLALSCFFGHVWLSHQQGFFPNQAWAWVQNMWKGPNSIFPIAPWLGFTFYGAALGVMIRWHGGKIPLLKWMICGVILILAGSLLDVVLGQALMHASGIPYALKTHGFHAHVGDVLMITSVLAWCEIRAWHFPAALQMIGKNTFFIYVTHVIVLYGAIFGVGLNDWLVNKLNPWQTAFGAIIFCALFAGLAILLEKRKSRATTHA